MNILTLSIKQKYFDEILAGKKTHEYREIRPTNAKKYITYLCGGKEYPADAELPEEGEVDLIARAERNTLRQRGFGLSNG